MAERTNEGVINVVTSSSNDGRGLHRRHIQPIGYAQPLGNAAAPIPQAPIGHLQPRARQFAPDSVPEQIEQQKMSAFDAEQRKLDEQLDKSLNICRCQ